MSVVMQLGVEGPVAVGTTVTELVRVPLVGSARRAAAGRGSVLVLWKSNVDVIVVKTSIPGLVVDGGAVPGIEQRFVQAAGMPCEIDISGASFVGIAGTSAGIVRMERK